MVDLSKATPRPWERVEATDNHGPYITSQWGTTLCDLYTMSNPINRSVANGGDSKPLPFVDADANATFIVHAVNLHDDLVKALDAQMRATTIALQSAGHPQSDIDDCTAQARSALRKARGEL